LAVFRFRTIANALGDRRAKRLEEYGPHRPLHRSQPSPDRWNGLQIPNLGVLERIAANETCGLTLSRQGPIWREPERPVMSIARRTLLAGGLALIGSGHPLLASEPRFPGATWEAPSHIAPEGWSAARLRVVEERVHATRPTAVIVVHDGTVVAAWGDVARTVNVRSIRKSLLSALYGIAVAEGRIDLNRTLADLGVHDNEPRLTVAEREATIRELLMSRSGVYHGATFEAPGVAGRPPRGSYPPGAFWYYQLGLQRPRHDLYPFDRREHLRGIRQAYRALDWDGGLPGQQGWPTGL
jgi:hypothetical protein